MRSVSEYLRDNPSARPSTIAFREECAKRLKELERDIAAKNTVAVPARKSILDRVGSWFGRRS